MNENKYCMHCMHHLEALSDTGTCMFCGHKLQQDDTPPHHLTAGTILNGKYLVGEAIGEGGFGITYIGRDLKLDMRIAVKEYYPNGYVNRNNTASSDLTVTTQAQKEFFDKGKEQFLSEARILAKFSGENGIVDVRDFFEENNTAYIVMEYLDGVTLKDYLKTHGVFEADTIFELMRPLMDSLALIHQKKLIHRDISPDNIMLLHSGKLKLMDFGAARLVNTDQQKSLSIMLKPGYAPEEQYRTKGCQGPWTDVYGLCATIYKCITGKTPDDAMERIYKDELKRPSELGVKISPAQERALMEGLKVRQNERCQSIEVFRRLISRDESEVLSHVEIAVPETGRDSQKAPVKGIKNEVVEDDDATVYKAVETPVKGNKSRPRKKRGLIIAAAIVCVIIAGAAAVKISSAMSQVTIDGKSVDKDRNYYSFYGDEIDKEKLSQVKKLKQLERLSFDNCSFDGEAAAMLAEFSYLTEMTFECCTGITDFNFLNGMNGLTELHISDCGLSDEMTVFEGFDALKTLELKDCPNFTDSSFLGDSWKLKYVDLSGSGITDFSGLASCINMIELNICHTRPKNLDFITAMPELSLLDVSGCGLTDVDIVKNCSKLSYFYADDNAIESISAITGLENLVTLSLKNNRIESVKENLKALRLARIYLDQNPLTDISGLSDMTVLKEFSMAGCGLECQTQEDLVFLKKSQAVLTDCDLSDNPVSRECLEVFENAAALDTLRLNHCQTQDGGGIGDLGFLANVTTLTDLEICGSGVNDISALANLDGLERLVLRDNSIEAVNQIPGQALKILDVSNNKITDLTGLPQIKYSRLLLYGNAITDTGILKGCSGSVLGMDDNGSLAGEDIEGFNRCYLSHVPNDRRVGLQDTLGIYKCNFGVVDLEENFTEEKN